MYRSISVVIFSFPPSFQGQKNWFFVECAFSLVSRGEEKNVLEVVIFLQRCSSDVFFLRHCIIEVPSSVRGHAKWFFFLPGKKGKEE